MKWLGNLLRLLLLLNLALVGAFLATTAVMANRDRIPTDVACPNLGSRPQPVAVGASVVYALDARCEVVPSARVDWLAHEARVGSVTFGDALVSHCTIRRCKAAEPALRFHLNSDFAQFDTMVGLLNGTPRRALAVLVVTVDGHEVLRRVVHPKEVVPLRLDVLHRKLVVLQWLVLDASRTLVVVTRDTGIHRPN